MIISNTCIAGHYQHIYGNKPYNPFAFCLMSPEDFIFLIENFSSIDFSKRLYRKEDQCHSIVYNFVKNDIYKINDLFNNNEIICEIDQKIEISYPHYEYCKNNIEKLNRRFLRLQNCLNSDNVYIYDNKSYATCKQIEKLRNLQKFYNIIFLTDIAPKEYVLSGLYIDYKQIKHQKLAEFLNMKGISSSI